MGGKIMQNIEQGKAILNKTTAKRNHDLGAIGELLAFSLLQKNNFTEITSANKIKQNFPFADLFAIKNGVRYCISVKTRNKYESNTKGIKKINARYKLGKKSYQLAEALSREHECIPAWIAIQVEKEKYSAYFGKLAQLNGNRAILMSDKHLKSYECLALDTEYTFEQLENNYEYKK